jgi:hypothetical protein
VTRTDYIRVDLRVDHPSIPATEMAEALGLSPSAVGVKGEPRGRLRRDRPVNSQRALWPWHYAAFSFGEDEGHEQLHAAFGIVENRAAQIASITESGGHVVLNVFAAPAFGWGVEIDAKELRLLVHCGVTLGIDIHRDPDDTPAAPPPDPHPR